MESNCLYVLMTCICALDNCFRCKYAYDERQDHWECTHARTKFVCGSVDFAAIASNSTKTIGRVYGKTNFTANEVAPVLVSLIGANPNVDTKTLREEANKYLMNVPSDSFLHRAKELAMKKTWTWGEDDDIAMLPAHVRAFEELGWGVHVEIMSYAQARRLVESHVRKVRNDLLKKAAAAAGGVADNPVPSLEDLMPRMDPEGTYVIGVRLTVPGAENLLGYLQNCTMLDFTHHKASFYGIHGNAIGLDADRHIVPLVYTIWLGSESGPAWEYLMQGAKAINGFDVPTRRACMDGALGAVQAHQETFEHAQRFRDKPHRQTNLGNQASGAAKQLYLALFGTATEQIFNLFSTSFFS